MEGILDRLGHLADRVYLVRKKVSGTAATEFVAVYFRRAFGGLRRG
jgi:hypothetical protein